MLRNNDDEHLSPPAPVSVATDKELSTGPLMFEVEVSRRVLKGSAFFNSPPNVGSFLQFLHLRLPRLDSVLAFLTALEFLAQERKEVCETDNVLELMAVAFFLGMPDLQALCAKRIVREMDPRKVVISGHLGAM